MNSRKLVAPLLTIDAPPALASCTRTVPLPAPLLTMVAVLAVEFAPKKARVFAPLLMMFAVPALAVAKNETVEPGNAPEAPALLIVEAPAVEASKNVISTVELVTLITAVPAVDVSKKFIEANGAPLLNTTLVPVPALAAFEKLKAPLFVNVWPTADPLATPAPTKVTLLLLVIVYPGAAGVKVMPSMVIGATMTGFSLFETAKVAVSPAASGTFAGAQFSGLFQMLSAEPGGAGSHVCAGLMVVERMKVQTAAAERMKSRAGWIERVVFKGKRLAGWRF